MSKFSLAPAPVIILTGANGGVGYGICQRLLFQLCQLNAPDSLPQHFASNVKSQEKAPVGYRGVTLIMACRNKQRASAARTKLLNWLENQRSTLRGLPNYDEDYTSTFIANCNVHIHELDLASVSSVLRFSAEIRKTYPYVSHLLLNAGVASFVGIDWIQCFKQLASGPIHAITVPAFYTQHIGEISGDNLGWVWQSNVFGHFVLFRELEETLKKSPFESTRVIWCSSLEASSHFYDSADWQLIKTDHSYEAAKYQIDLIANCLDLIALQNSETTKVTRHFVGEPGVCSTSISKALVSGLLDEVKVIAFYIARLFGSPHHTILPWCAAVTFVHLVLAPLCYLPIFLNNDPSKPVRFSAQTGRWGDEYVGLTEVKEWEKHKEEGYALIKKCDKLYESFKQAEAVTQDI
ncbi:3-keto-steroid reductase [Psilocybe cubensis]|uniref:3-keto sterol reductase n=2 Tax=Psilocybe cubensis TaxID=181762 RepID=A0A8H8CLB6_PSICU|nr:3-keto-steroid reductase [Psilocybe cubensis]KAH9483103.1 3-keto-steroid reductase [Psilocybe cubensis]